MLPDPPRRPPFLEAVGIVLRACLRSPWACVAAALPAAALSSTSGMILDRVLTASGGGLDPLDIGTWVVVGVAVLAAGGSAALAFLVVYPAGLVGLAWVGVRAVFDEPTPPREAIRRIGDRGPVAVGAFGLTVVLVLAAPVTLAMLMLVASLAAGVVGAVLVGVLLVLSLVWPAGFVLVRLALAVPVVAAEAGTVSGALARSNELVRGAFWWVLGLLLVAAIVGSVLGSLLAAPFTAAGGGWPVTLVGRVLAGVVSISFGGVAVGVAYASRILPATEPARPASEPAPAAP